MIKAKSQVLNITIFTVIYLKVMVFNLLLYPLKPLFPLVFFVDCSGMLQDLRDGGTLVTCNQKCRG